MKKILVIIIGIMVSLPAYSKNTTIKNFRQAKVILTTMYTSTFYCPCKIENSYDVSEKDCEYTPKGKYKNPYRVEYDHILPSWLYAKFFSMEGTRRDFKKQAHYKLFEADIHNLVPSIKELNRVKRNYPFGMVPGEDRLYGDCDFERMNRVVEPKPEIRGIIARAYIYVYIEYFKQCPPSIYIEWDKKHPVTKDECALSRKKSEIQGNDNFVTKRQCIKLNMW